jgi:hypothetical protein
MTAAQKDLAGNDGPAKQYNTFLSTAATRLDDDTTVKDSTTLRRRKTRRAAPSRDGSGDTARRGKMARQHNKKVLAARR